MKAFNKALKVYGGIFIIYGRWIKIDEYSSFMVKYVLQDNLLVGVGHMGSNCPLILRSEEKINR